jgi:hypothetical protein
MASAPAPRDLEEAFVATVDVVRRCLITRLLVRAGSTLIGVGVITLLVMIGPSATADAGPGSGAATGPATDPPVSRSSATAGDRTPVPTPPGPHPTRPPGPTSTLPPTGGPTPPVPSHPGPTAPPPSIQPPPASGSTGVQTPPPRSNGSNGSRTAAAGVPVDRSGGQGGQGGLALTGTKVLPLAGTAAAMVLLGTALVLLSMIGRRRPGIGPEPLS